MKRTYLNKLFIFSIFSLSTGITYAGKLVVDLTDPEVSNCETLKVDMTNPSGDPIQSCIVEGEDPKPVQKNKNSIGLRLSKEQIAALLDQDPEGNKDDDLSKYVPNILFNLEYKIPTNFYSGMNDEPGAGIATENRQRYDLGFGGKGSIEIQFKGPGLARINATGTANLVDSYYTKGPSNLAMTDRSLVLGYSQIVRLGRAKVR